jgi:hypothetical protein
MPHPSHPSQLNYSNFEREIQETRCALIYKSCLSRDNGYNDVTLHMDTAQYAAPVEMQNPLKSLNRTTQNSVTFATAAFHN